MAPPSKSPIIHPHDPVPPAPLHTQDAFVMPEFAPSAAVHVPDVDGSTKRNQDLLGDVFSVLKLQDWTSYLHKSETSHSRREADKRFPRIYGNKAARSSAAHPSANSRSSGNSSKSNHNHSGPSITRSLPSFPTYNRDTNVETSNGGPASRESARSDKNGVPYRKRKAGNTNTLNKAEDVKSSHSQPKAPKPTFGRVLKQKPRNNGLLPMDFLGLPSSDARQSMRSFKIPKKSSKISDEPVSPLSTAPLDSVSPLSSSPQQNGELKKAAPQPEARSPLKTSKESRTSKAMGTKSGQNLKSNRSEIPVKEKERPVTDMLRKDTTIMNNTLGKTTEKSQMKTMTTQEAIMKNTKKDVRGNDPTKDSSRNEVPKKPDSNDLPRNGASKQDLRNTESTVGHGAYDKNSVRREEKIVGNDQTTQSAGPLNPTPKNTRDTTTATTVKESTTDEDATVDIPTVAPSDSASPKIGDTFDWSLYVPTTTMYDTVKKRKRNSIGSKDASRSSDSTEIDIAETPRRAPKRQRVSRSNEKSKQKDTPSTNNKTSKITQQTKSGNIMGTNRESDNLITPTVSHHLNSTPQNKKIKAANRTKPWSGRSKSDKLFTPQVNSSEPSYLNKDETPKESLDSKRRDYIDPPTQQREKIVLKIKRLSFTPNNGQTLNSSPYVSTSTDFKPDQGLRAQENESKEGKQSHLDQKNGLDNVSSGTHGTEKIINSTINEALVTTNKMGKPLQTSTTIPKSNTENPLSTSTVIVEKKHSSRKTDSSSSDDDSDSSSTDSGLSVAPMSSKTVKKSIPKNTATTTTGTKKVISRLSESSSDEGSDQSSPRQNQHGDSTGNSRDSLSSGSSLRWKKTFQESDEASICSKTLKKSFASFSLPKKIFQSILSESSSDDDSD